MNYKILYWVDQSLITFGLAKVMRDKGDFEQFAIFDCTNKPKKFYNEQGIINFKKIWFYHDFIKKGNQHPNYEYLRKIENLDLIFLLSTKLEIHHPYKTHLIISALHNLMQ